MPCVIRLVGLVSGQAHPYDGQYVVEYDPSVGATADECLLRVSPNIDRARRYAYRSDAHEEWRRVDARRPWRSDGKPNRPLTAWSVAIEAVFA